MGSDLSECDIDFEVESDHELEFSANTLRTYRHAANESQSELHVEITKHILFDEKCKELAF